MAGKTFNGINPSGVISGNISDNSSTVIRIIEVDAGVAIAGGARSPVVVTNQVTTEDVDINASRGGVKRIETLSPPRITS